MGLNAVGGLAEVCGGQSNSTASDALPTAAAGNKGQCLTSDSGPAEQTAWREDTRLGWWRREGQYGCGEG